MQEMFSKTEDVNFLANELKKILGSKIAINRFTLVQEVLTGKICLDPTKIARFEGIDFNIKFSKGEFLRINIGEINLLTSYKEKENALKLLTETLSKIEIEPKVYIGYPDAFYQIDNEGFFVPYCDWAFSNKEEYLSELINNTMYDDASVENLIIFDENLERKIKADTLKKIKADK